MMSSENSQDDKIIKSEKGPEKIEDQTMDEVKTEETSENGKEVKEEEKEEEPVEMVEIPKPRLEELETAEVRVLEEIKRERASAINYRKRLEKQRDDFADIASARILGKLIAVKDDIARIIENGSEEIPKEHMKGIKLVQQRIDGMFENEGVSLIKIKPGKTAYDPNKHEAIFAQAVDKITPNTIISVVSHGFQYKERILKAAQVIISKAIPKEEPKEEKIEEVKESNSVQENKETNETT
jgi:molecular chaperone GrpE